MYVYVCMKCLKWTLFSIFRSYTNVTNIPVKKIALDTPYLSDRHNGTKIQTHQVLSHTHVENPATNMLSPKISHSTNIVLQRTHQEIISNTNFSSIPHIKQSNNVQTQENVTDCIRIIRDNNFENKQNSTDHINLSQEINKPETNSDNTNTICHIFLS